jgi:hypothetical protein
MGSEEGIPLDNSPGWQKKTRTNQMGFSRVPHAAVLKVFFAARPVP